MKRYGVHVNAYTVSDGGEVSMWLARRSSTKQTYPGLLDNMVGRSDRLQCSGTRVLTLRVIALPFR